MWAGPATDPDRYELLSSSTPGGEGSLWRSRMTIDGVPVDVAVKVIHAHNLAHGADDWRARWHRQAEVLKSLDHPGLVRVRDVFEGPEPHPRGGADLRTNTLYLVMNWVDGVGLDEWVAQRPGLAVSDRLALVGRLASAVDYLQSGPVAGRSVLHRDIKPANVVVHAGGVTLVDFGLVRLMTDSDLTSSIGTPAYWAPEVAMGDPYTDAADRYSFGATAYFVLTGERPRPTDPRAMWDRLASLPGVREPATFAARAMAMLAQDPQQRPARCGRWVQDLTALVAPDGLTSEAPTRLRAAPVPLMAPPPPPAPPPPAPVPPPPITTLPGPLPTAGGLEVLRERHAHQRRVLGIVVGGVAVLALAGVAAAVMMNSSDQRSTDTTSATTAAPVTVVVATTGTAAPVAAATTAAAPTTAAPATAAPTTAAPTTAAPSTAAPTTGAPPAVAVTTTLAEGTRVAHINSNKFRIREEPAPDSPALEICDTCDGYVWDGLKKGLTLLVIGPPENGWYRVRYGDDEGWTYALWIKELDRPLAAYRTKDGDMAQLYDTSGTPVVVPGQVDLGDEKVLAFADDGTWLDVLLPTGATYRALKADFERISTTYEP